MCEILDDVLFPFCGVILCLRNKQRPWHILSPLPPPTPALSSPDPLQGSGGPHSHPFSPLSPSPGGPQRLLWAGRGCYPSWHRPMRPQHIMYCLVYVIPNNRHLASKLLLFNYENFLKLFILELF